ncbi:MAG TPA: hypothetical protein VK141_02675 [Nitrosomonas sp.]|nr:hypothetical protein [Nitrosomonas sp.]
MAGGTPVSNGGKHLVDYHLTVDMAAIQKSREMIEEKMREKSLGMFGKHSEKYCEDICRKLRQYTIFISNKIEGDSFLADERLTLFLAKALQDAHWTAEEIVSIDRTLNLVLGDDEYEIIVYR